jgi:3-hydroxybutyryl-CoA dehydratase
MQVEFAVGEQATFAKTITEADINAYANLTGDFNPLHIDEEYAQTTRFGGRIAHGMLIVGLVSTVLGTKLPGPGAIYVSQQIKFLNPVRIGDTITAVVEVKSYQVEKRLLSLRTDCYNQGGDHILSGEATLKIPKVRQR